MWLTNIGEQARDSLSDDSGKLMDIDNSMKVRKATSECVHQICF